MTTTEFSDPDACAREIVERVGGIVNLALPLGLGKASSIANALYSLAKRDKSIELNIFTALTLEKPTSGSLLEARLLEPLVRSMYADVTDLEYAHDVRQGTTPSNITVTEFFFRPGAFLGLPEPQRNYTSVNYTHVARDLARMGINVVAQLVALEGHRISLGCNPDVTLDLLGQPGQQSKVLLAGEVTSRLPFMEGAAAIEAERADILLKKDTALFPVPNDPVSLAQHAIAIRAAALVKDGGTLQIGIGGIGDAIAYALSLRQRDNETFRSLVGALGIDEPETDRFEKGLYGASEMFVEGFLSLHKAGVMKRTVDGAWLHAGFFLGSGRFYRELEEMNREDRDRIHMMPISFTNQLFGDEGERRRARIQARFMNTAMMVTLLGAVVSDGLENGQVVSGVGGQYNFVAMAHELESGRSVILVPATRRHKGRVTSNIVWQYGHATIPRHLRDIVVTEYGTADLRAASDTAVIKNLLNIADSRFQERLRQDAIEAGKLPREYQIPHAYRSNVPEALERKFDSGLRQALPHYPLGTDLTETESELRLALERLEDLSSSRWKQIRWFLEGLRDVRDPRLRRHLERMKLSGRTSARERIYASLVARALRATILESDRPLTSAPNLWGRSKVPE